MRSSFWRIFDSFQVRNYRLYIVGQGLSMCGTWMQTIGLTWLVYELTHSGTQVGLVIAAQFLPILLFGVWGGVIADRFNKRRVLYVTQTAFGILAFILGTLVVTHNAQLWMIYTIAFGLGIVTVIDSPSRQTFVIEMVGSERLRNAITLNSTIANAARVIGPSFAGILIATVGVGPLFLINAASYLAVLIALKLMDQKLLHPTPRSMKQSGQIRAGIAYAWHVPRLRSTLLMMIIIGTFAYEFPVILPLFATHTLHGNAGTYSSMMAAMGFGAVFGGLYSAGQGAGKERQLIWSAVLFGCCILLVSIMSTFALVLLVMVAVGAMSVLFVSLGSTTLQLTSDPTMRGRVMALWSIGFQGTTPIGGPIIGYISDHSNPRIGLAVGGISAIVAGIVGYLMIKGRHHSRHVAV